MKNLRIVPKSVFKAHALQFFREVEQTGESLIITDRGRPVLRLVPFQETNTEEILATFKGAVKLYDSPVEPVGEDDWGA